MSEFRPTVATLPTPKPSPLRRNLALTVAAAALLALVAQVASDDGRARVSAASGESSTVPERSGWDRAIESIVGAAPAPSTAPDDMPGRPTLAATELRPEIVAGAVAGYVLAGDVPPALAEAGLRAGDVLTTIDGLPIDAARAGRLADEFGGLDDVEVSYMRGGRLQDTMIVFRER